jgi:C1A family cysteine protease
MPLVDHAVSIVGWGYNETYDSEYFIIKNSFGTQWGEDGFARISTKTSEKLPYGSCGILSVIY